MLEILDCGAFAQEFRIGYDLQLNFGTPFAEDALDLVAGSDRHGRFGHDHCGVGQQRRDLAYGFIYEAQIGMPVAPARRRPNRDEYRLGVGDRRQVHREAQPALANIAGDKFGQSRLENRNLATLERSDPSRILVDADHMMAEVGQASA